MKKRARAISGGNHHFEFCSVLIYLCFQKGWTHDKFSIVQSVAGACYHMMLSAHLRGYATIWNAGIGDTRQIAEMLGIPPTFEIQGALCIGRPKPTAPDMKAPRRPQGEVWSVNTFERPVRAAYPAKPAAAYPFLQISNARNPFAEWRPQVWGWDRIADFRGYAVWAKSPIAGVYRSRRQGETTAAELSFLPKVGAGAPRRRCDAVGRHAHNRTRERVARRCAARRRRPCCGQSHLHAGAAAAGGRAADRRRAADGRPEASAARQQRRYDHAVSGAGAYAGAGAIARRGRACAQAGRQRRHHGAQQVFTLRLVLLPLTDTRAGAEPGAVRSARGARRARDGRRRASAIEREAGISLGKDGDGKIVEGALRYVARVYAMRVSKIAR